MILVYWEFKVLIIQLYNRKVQKKYKLIVKKWIYSEIKHHQIYLVKDK